MWLSKLVMAIGVKVNSASNVNQEEQPASKTRALEKLRRDMGAEFLKALQDPRTVEVMLNADGQLWVERLGEEMKVVGLLRSFKAEAIIRTVAGYHGKVITAESPIIEATFPLDGSRFAGQLPPIVERPTFALRKKAASIFTLEQYVENGVMTQAQKEVLIDAVNKHKNILIIGGTGSGKTTLVNAVIHQMVVSNPAERVFIIEDTGEIQCSAKNHVQFYTTPEISMTALLKATLRMRPDRILVGEVRGPEALDLLMSWNTGHEGGAATLHANNARAGLDRLSMLISMHRDAPARVEPLIAEVVHIVVHIARTEGGRKVEEILKVEGYENGEYVTTKL